MAKQSGARCLHGIFFMMGGGADRYTIKRCFEYYCLNSELKTNYPDNTHPSRVLKYHLNPQTTMTAEGGTGMRDVSRDKVPRMSATNSNLSAISTNELSPYPVFSSPTTHA